MRFECRQTLAHRLPSTPRIGVSARRGVRAVSLLQVESVTTSYWRGELETEVLRGASLVVDPGKLVSVYGGRNSGKTALLRIAGGFERPKSGRVTFAGVDLLAATRSELAAIHRDEIGWIDRSGPRSPELDVRTYLALPFYGQVGSRAAHRRAVEALAAVGVAGYAHQTWDELTDVARVLCAIAYARPRHRRLLIADDPTAGLGILDREHVCGVLRGLAENDGAGVLMAVPDMPSMLHAHEVHLLARGRLLAPPDSGQPASRRAYQS